MQKYRSKFCFKILATLYRYQTLQVYCNNYEWYCYLPPTITCLVYCRRCWPDPSDAAARRDAATHSIPRATASTSRPVSSVSTVELLDTETPPRGQENRGFDPADGGATSRLWSRRVEDAASNTQGAQLGWQVRNI